MHDPDLCPVLFLSRADKPKTVSRRRVAQSSSWRRRSIEKGNPSCPRTRAKPSIVISEGHTMSWRSTAQTKRAIEHSRDNSPEISALGDDHRRKLVCGKVHESRPSQIPSRGSPTPQTHFATLPSSPDTSTILLEASWNRDKRLHYNKMSVPDVFVASCQPLPPFSTPGQQIPFHRRSWLPLLSASPPINSSMPSTPCPSRPSSPCDLPTVCDRSYPTP